MDFTQEQKDQYIKHNGCFCPFCGCQECDLEEIIDDTQRTQWCPECNSIWLETFAMIDIKPIENNHVTTAIMNYHKEG